MAHSLHFFVTISPVISHPHTGQLKRLFDLGATESLVALKPKVDCRITCFLRYQRLTEILCPPGRYRKSCSIYAKRSVQTSLHYSGRVPEAENTTQCTTTNWLVKSSISVQILYWIYCTSAQVHVLYY